MLHSAISTLRGSQMEVALLLKLEIVNFCIYLYKVDFLGRHDKSFAFLRRSGQECLI